MTMYMTLFSKYFPVSGTLFRKDPENGTEFRIFRDLFHNGNGKKFRMETGTGIPVQTLVGLKVHDFYYKDL